MTTPDERYEPVSVPDLTPWTTTRVLVFVGFVLVVAVGGVLGFYLGLPPSERGPILMSVARGWPGFVASVLAALAYIKSREGAKAGQANAHSLNSVLGPRMTAAALDAHHIAQDEVDPSGASERADTRASQPQPVVIPSEIQPDTGPALREDTTP